VRSAPIQPPDPSPSDGVVTLRLRRESDLEAIAAASHDPQTVRWLDDAPMDSQARAASADRVQAAWQTGRAAPLVIADAITDAPVGMVNLQFRGDDVAAVAYSVFPASRGRGIAPRAVRLVAAWAFHEIGLAELVLETDRRNLASIRVAEKAGFQRTGVRQEPRPDGERHELIVFSLVQPDN
jgi:RimJ/RimL family protein N-acetyltransferase